MLIRLGTRGSNLARAQTESIARRLAEHGHETEIRIIRTTGDRDTTRGFAEIGSPGLFVREIEQALLDRAIDVAVHSYKDLPSQTPEELLIAAVPERRSPCDRLVMSESAYDPDAGVIPIRQGATLGTASSRRRALLGDLRPDLSVASLRGNVPTRLGRLREGLFDGILLAAAGLDRLDQAADAAGTERLDRAGLVEVDLDPAVFTPAPSQGALALEARADDAFTRDALESLHDEQVARPVRAERRLLALVQGGCEVPFGAWCRPTDDGRLAMGAVIEWSDGLHRADTTGDDPFALADAAWEVLRPKPGVRGGGR